MEKYFSQNYRESRRLFLEATAGWGNLTSFEHPHRGPDGERLFVDIFVTGDPHSDKTLLHIVGTHGVEAFAGAAIQQAVLPELQKRDPAQLPKLIFVHPLNPFGMAWLRRGNHHNVDLNRNYINSSQMPSTSPLFKHLLSPMTAGSKLSILLKSLRLVPLLRQQGAKGLIQAIAQGQYEYPEAPFYGGQEIQPELQFLHQFLQEELRTCAELWVLDVHTGLGTWGEDTLLVDEMDGAGSVEQMRSLFAERVVSEGDAEVEYTVYGKLAQCVRSAVSQASIYYATQEFGTYSKLTVMTRSILENRNFTEKGPQVEGAIKENFKECFFPSSTQWRSSVLELGQRRYFQVLNHLIKK